MSAKFYTLLTDIGAAKLASAAALGIPLKITQMAVGDGGGALPTPSAQQTALVAEKRRAALNMLYIDPQNSSQIIAEQVIPENEGGWWIREVGLFDETGALIAVGNCPESYKPQLAEGSGRTQTVRMVLITSSTDNITLKIDPAVVLATRKYVDDKVLELKVYVDDLMAKHLAAADPHTQYAPKASPTFTGTPKAPTAAAGNNSTQLANTAFVQAAIAALVASSPAALDTLNELAAALGNDPNFATTMTNALAGKMDKAANGKDIADVSEFLKNLGLHETGFATLTTSGSFTVPVGVTELCISAVAGGGGGGSGGGGDSSFFGGGGGSGGAGESIVKRKFAVTPGTVINITIGSGGIGSIASAATGSAPTAGGNTVIGSLITLHGGQPGINAGNGQTTAPGGGYGQGFPTGSYGGDGSLNVGSGNGSPGASSPFGGGGGAGRAGTDQGTDGTAGSGYGSGGGSGGGKYGTAPLTARGGNGGNGAPGIVMIEW
ncbi:phage tail protein [Citrobacter sp. SX206]|uniref:phage tail protein n=1 Tax=unclassified Citrobacter TaxID=2644389 RepID=UPI0020A45036|nr:MULTISPECIES: phage tail protein [unclassified Citrobacter]UTD17917.1 phage tail protein [Citrobacter sp. SX206]UTD22208.1 phage tail protein [Citrobacter sp. SX212]